MGRVADVTVRLIATDLDGTVVGYDLSVSGRVVCALTAARAGGIPVVPVTARAPIGVRLLVGDLGMDGWAVCSNGALGVHLGTGEVLFEQQVDVAVQREFAARLLRAAPDAVFASLRAGGGDFVAQHGYTARYEDHKRSLTDMVFTDLDGVLSAPSIKLIVRHPRLRPDELLAIADGLDVAGCDATISGAPFLEVMSAGVSKASGLALLCDRLGVTAAEVVAFGDGLNDAEMLAWAGRGVAMADGHPVTVAAADETTVPVTQDGVAVVIEEILRDR